MVGLRGCVAGAGIFAALMVGAVGDASAHDKGRAEAYYYGPSSWSGTYLGVHGGFAWSDIDTDNFDGNGTFVISTTRKDDGPFWGFQLGHNFMVGPNLLIGVEGDFSFAAIDGSVTSSIATGTSRTDSETDWIATVRGRLGWTGGSWLVYATGGVAFRHEESTRTVLATVPPSILEGRSASDGGTDTGWVVGGGVEWAFAHNWSMKLEYQRLQFNDVDRRFEYPGFFATAQRETHSDVTIDTVRVGLNYRFGDRERDRPMK